jgi:IstB-like ATP binding protein
MIEDMTIGKFAQKTQHDYVQRVKDFANYLKRSPVERDYQGEDSYLLYKRASRLLADLAQARGEGRLPRLMTRLERTNLIIIDDWGPEPLTPEQRRDLLEIVDDRYDKGSS